MPIHRALHQLWTLVTRRRAVPRTTRAGLQIDRSGPPARVGTAEPPLTAGNVQLRLWSVGPYVIVAGTAAEAARALDRFAADRDPRWRDEARRLRAALGPGDLSGDALRVAV